MPTKIGTQDLLKAYAGTTSLEALYAGDTNIWSSFSPNLISGLTVWWDAADLASITTQWTDKSGNEKHGAVNGTPVPTIQTNALNGKQVVRFTQGQGRIRQNATGITKNYTLIVVNRKWRTGATGGRCISTPSPGPNTWYGYHVNPPPTGNMDSFADGTFSPAIARAADLTWQMYSVDGASTPSYSPRVFINGVYRQQAVTGGNGLGGYLYISGYQASGTAETGDFEVAEVLLYNRKLSDAERQQVEGYLRTKWGLP